MKYVLVVVAKFLMQETSPNLLLQVFPRRTEPHQQQNHQISPSSDQVHSKFNASSFKVRVC